MSDIAIRWARQSDGEDIRSLLDRSWRAHWAPHLQFGALARYDAARPVDAYVSVYLERFRVAERGDVVVGMYHLEDDHLHAIHVDTWALGTGVGKALMNAAEAEGARKLEVRAFNTRALDFYRARGWTEMAEYEDFEMGESVRTIAMERL